MLNYVVCTCFRLWFQGTLTDGLILIQRTSKHNYKRSRLHKITAKQDKDIKSGTTGKGQMNILKENEREIESEKEREKERENNTCF